MHPVTLLCVVLLVVNDWVLKRQFRDGFAHDVVGKLSDVAGLAFAPVVLTAAIGLVLALAARLGAHVDPSLTRRRLLACIAATGAVFAAIKLSPDVAALFVRVLSVIRPAEVVLDRTDLLALPALAVAYWIGRDELRRIPLGKPAAIHRLGRPAHGALVDSHIAGADTKQLADAIDTWDVTKIDALLAAGR
jgi:hypothetical protein